MRPRCSLALLLLSFAAAGAQTITSFPFPGITLIHRKEGTPRRINMHIALVDLNEPGIRFHLTPPGGPRETVRQTTLTFLSQEHAQVAVNAHFFLPFPSEEPDSFLIGLAASDGDAYSTFEVPEQSYAIVPNAPALNLDRQNRAAIVTEHGC